jgi:hypothetical protein
MCRLDCFIPRFVESEQHKRSTPLPSDDSSLIACIVCRMKEVDAII